MELGGKESKAVFTTGVHEVASLFIGIVIFFCEGFDGGVYVNF